MSGEERTIYPTLPEPLRSEAIRAHDALHSLWSRVPRDSTYDKKKWQELESMIEALVRRANGG